MFISDVDIYYAHLHKLNAEFVKVILSFFGFFFHMYLGIRSGRKTCIQYDYILSRYDKDMFSLSKDDEMFLKKINTPNKIQDYLDSIPFNFEERGVTCMSPTQVLAHKKAHCLEGAMLAAVALWLSGKRPLILSLKVAEGKGDFDHAVALYKENGYWGAISKTNHNVLRFRDPVYKTVRELAMSYFHEYFLTSDGSKTLVGYSRPISLKQFGTAWVTSSDDVWNIGTYIFNAPHTSIVKMSALSQLRKASVLERKAASIAEYKK